MKRIDISIVIKKLLAVWQRAVQESREILQENSALFCGKSGEQLCRKMEDLAGVIIADMDILFAHCSGGKARFRPFTAEEQISSPAEDDGQEDEEQPLFTDQRKVQAGGSRFTPPDGPESGEDDLCLCDECLADHTAAEMLTGYTDILKAGRKQMKALRRFRERGVRDPDAWKKVNASIEHMMRMLGELSCALEDAYNHEADDD